MLYGEGGEQYPLWILGLRDLGSHWPSPFRRAWPVPGVEIALLPMAESPLSTRGKRTSRFTICISQRNNWFKKVSSVDARTTRWQIVGRTDSLQGTKISPYRIISKWTWNFLQRESEWTPSSPSATPSSSSQTYAHLHRDTPMHMTDTPTCTHRHSRTHAHTRTHTATYIHTYRDPANLAKI